jgi:hypothetical protein
MKKSPMSRAIAIVCFALSGFAALVCEICWIRKASLVFGSATLALSTVVAVGRSGYAAGVVSGFSAGLGLSVGSSVV